MKAFSFARPRSVSRLLFALSALGGLAVRQTGAQVATATESFRWLDNITSPRVRAWVTEQNAATAKYLAAVPERDAIDTLVASESRYPSVEAPFGAGEALFFFANDGSQNQPVLYVQDKPTLPARVLIDPNAFSRDGLIAIVDQAPSSEGRYLAYAGTTQGSAWRVVRIRDVRSSQDLADELHGIKSSPIAWTHDERGFFYVRSDAGRPSIATNPMAPDGRQQVLYHRLGQPQKADALVFDDAQHPDWELRAEVSQDGQYLVIAASVGAEKQNRLYFIDLDNPKRPNLRAPIVRLFDGGDAIYDFIDNAGPLFFVRTTKEAPRGRIVAVDINSPTEAHWTNIVRETYDPIIDARRVDDRLIAHRLHDAHSVLALYTLDGQPRGEISLPGAGTVMEMHGRSAYHDLYFRYSSFVQRPDAYRYDLETRAVAVFKQTPVDSSLVGYETTRLYFTSEDGTRVPMFITARRDITLDRNHPALLSGFGAFSVSETPVFSPLVAAWLKLGGVYAVANVRGGGEDGRAWHEAATGAHKQVSVDDFLAAAQFLVGQRYTRPALLGVAGHGAGALLGAAAVVERPNLFGAAVLDAGIYDMARFNRFTAGPTWVPEFGSPDSPTSLQALLAYSPLQNLRPDVRYPPMLISDGEHDGVSAPVQSFTFAAALQARRGASSSLHTLLRVDFDTGFGPGTPVANRVALASDQLAFLIRALRGAY